VYRAHRDTTRPRFEVRELGEIDMVSRARATLDLVTHDDAWPAFPAVHLEGHTVLSYGELAGLVGESERVLRHDGKALVLCAGDRDLPTLLAYLAALRLVHAVAFLPASDEVLSAYQPEFVVPAPGSEAGLGGLGYRPAAEPIAGTAVFQRNSQPAGETWSRRRCGTTPRGTWHPSSSRARCACGEPARTPCATGGHRRTPGSAAVFGRPPIMALPATAVQRRQECGTGGQLVGALRELIG
jgi:hypothetical protein